MLVNITYENFLEIWDYIQLNICTLNSNEERFFLTFTDKFTFRIDVKWKKIIVPPNIKVGEIINIRFIDYQDENCIPMTSKKIYYISNLEEFIKTYEWGVNKDLDPQYLIEINY